MLYLFRRHSIKGEVFSIDKSPEQQQQQQQPVHQQSVQQQVKVGLLYSSGY